MNITPDWIVGFVDGQGVFSFKQSVKTQIYDFYFVLNVHKKSVSTLYGIKNVFKCGSIHKTTQTTMQYKVTCHKHLIYKIIPFFEQNPLKTTKKKSFQIFAHKCLNGIDYDLKTTRANDLTLDWLIGLMDAKGCFVCRKVQNQYMCQMVIGFNMTDVNILYKIQNYLGWGTRYNLKNGITLFQLKSQNHLYNFIKKYLLTRSNRDRLRTHKRIVARKWSKIVLLKCQNKHPVLLPDIGILAGGIKELKGQSEIKARDQIDKTYDQFKQLLKP